MTRTILFSILLASQVMAAQLPITIDTSLIWKPAPYDSTWWRENERLKYDTSSTIQWYSDSGGAEFCLAKMRGGKLLDADSLIPKSLVEKILNINLNTQRENDNIAWVKDSLYYEYVWSEKHKLHKIGACR